MWGKFSIFAADYAPLCPLGVWLAYISDRIGYVDLT